MTDNRGKLLFKDIFAYKNINQVYHTPNIDLQVIVREPGSSVSVVSGYGLDDRAIEVRYPA
jgi:hypothetical protein